MKKPINIGIVGLGRLGALYSRYFSNRIQGARVQAVTDIRPEITKAVAAEVNATPYANIHDLLADPAVDAVVVTTPTKYHVSAVVAAAAAGKAIFCEKPLSLDIKEAETMRDAVNKSGVFFQLGFMRRFDKAYAVAKQKIMRGEIGKPVAFKSTSRDQSAPPIDYLRPENSGGLFIDMGIHDFDLARWFMGDASSVFSVGGSLAYPEIGGVGDVDNALSVINFNSGAIGSVSLSRSGVFGYSIFTEIVGTEGTLQIGYEQETAVRIMTKDVISHDTVPGFFERFEQAYLTQLQNFIDNLHNDRPSPITCDDGIGAQKLALAATRSLKSTVLEKV